MRPEEELLEAYRELHPTVLVQLADLKEKYISPQERKTLEMFYGEACVKQVFGEPTHLDKAEMLLFEVQEGKMSEASKCQKLIDISKEIVKACLEKKIFDYNFLETRIPIVLLLNPFITCISIKDLEKMSKWANSPEPELDLKNLNANKMATLKYILENLYLSLDLIVKDLRKKI